MTLNPVPIATTGATHTAQQFRMMIRDLARNNQGITTGLDLKVTALGTPGAGVQISAGSAVIAGAVSPIQGHYSAYNIGPDTVSISAAGGTPRSDMLVLRVEDPDYEGTRDPAVDPIVFWEVVPNVGSSATTVPSGYSAIPLARIDIPASTGTITNAMIKDLRKVANPRRERVPYPYYVTGSLTEISGTTAIWKFFPELTLATVPVPAWAAKAQVIFSVNGLRLSTGNVFGAFRFALGPIEAVQSVYIDDNGGTGVRRVNVTMAETIDLSTTAGAAIRGTNQAVQARMRTDPLNSGKIGVDSSTTFIADIEFLEGAL
ncbi:hypothetical protein ACIOEZ_34280 [Streptomyces sp. NPDC087866]|uniref:hypothetical protein n=1 Tax=Streptomyces sp. NPDC087866 TaxID=3365815 RepID=UPI00382C9124